MTSRLRFRISARQVFCRRWQSKTMQHRAKLLTDAATVPIISKRGQVDEELRRSEPSGKSSRWPGFEPAIYGLRRRIDEEHPGEFSRSFDRCHGPDADRRRGTCDPSRRTSAVVDFAARLRR